MLSSTFVDEFSYRMRHHYLTLVVGHDKRRVVWAGKGSLEQVAPDEAPGLLDQWLAWAARSRLAPFVKLARTVRKHAAGILAYLDTKMTNGPVEGINNKLRVIARRAYGFDSHGALISMLFLCRGGIELAPPVPHAFEEIRNFPHETRRDQRLGRRSRSSKTVTDIWIRNQ